MFPLHSVELGTCSFTATQASKDLQDLTLEGIKITLYDMFYSVLQIQPELKVLGNKCCFTAKMK